VGHPPGATVGRVTVEVGILGAGFIARYHAMQLALAREQEPNRIVAVHDPDRSRAEGFCATEGGRVVDRVDEVIDAADAVFVCSWTANHLDSVRAVVDAGLPVFCEKPLSTDLASARQLVEAVERARVPNMVGLVLRSSPALLALRELVRDPEVGRVISVVFRDDQYLPTQGMYGSTWRAEVAKAGSGVLLEHSIHDLDVLEWLFGEVDSVVAREANVHGLDGIEDSVSVLAGLRSGATASLVSVWHDVLSRPSQRRMEVFCERALLTLEGDVFGPVRRQDSDGELVLDGDELAAWLTERGVPLVSAEQQFLAAVRARADGAQVPALDPDVRHALRAHVLADAVYRSSRGGGLPVTVPPPDPSPPPAGR
jgi:predicted dehydrogenase